MAEFREIMKIYNRNCDSRRNCDDCCLYQDDMSCTSYLKDYPKEAEELLLKWAEEHLVKTNADRLNEVFGVKTILTGCQGIQCQSGNSCQECEYHHFWEKEYKEK